MVQELDEKRFGTTWRCRQDCDLEAAMRDSIVLLSRRNLSFEMSWVKRHADRRKHADKFTWEETWNVEADAEATLAEKSMTAVDDSRWPERHQCHWKVRSFHGVTHSRAETALCSGSTPDVLL